MGSASRTSPAWRSATSPSCTRRSTGTARNGVGVKGRAEASWTEAAFFKQFNQFAAAMPAGIPVAGPASGSATYLAQLGSFLKGQPRVKLSTFHAYPLKHCTPGKVVTTSQLLSPAATSGFAQAQAQYVNVSHRYGKLARLDEMNGITCGGYGGVSERVRVGAVGARHAVRARQGRRRRGQHPDRPRRRAGDLRTGRRRRRLDGRSPRVLRADDVRPGRSGRLAGWSRSRRRCRRA